MQKEFFKDIKGYEGLYQISSFGRVKSFGNGGINQYSGEESFLKPQNNGYGYLHVTLSRDNERKTVLIHKLVLSTFRMNPSKKPCANHKDCNKHNNHLTNLEWVTYSENAKHAIKNGLWNVARGEKASQSKLKETQVRVIWHLKDIKPKMTTREVAKCFNVAIMTIGKIWHRKTWKHITT